MVTDPDGTFGRLGDFTGLDIGGFAQNPVWRTELLQDATPETVLWRGPHWGRPVSAIRTGLWREALTGDEISAI